MQIYLWYAINCYLVCVPSLVHNILLVLRCDQKCLQINDLDACCNATQRRNKNYFYSCIEACVYMDFQWQRDASKKDVN